ncbi:putative RNA-directed DNA polymerase [Tanacetum coccineum]
MNEERTRMDQVEEVENRDTTTITPSTEELPHNSEPLAEELVQNLETEELPHNSEPLAGRAGTNFETYCTTSIQYIVCCSQTLDDQTGPLKASQNALMNLTSTLNLNIQSLITRLLALTMEKARMTKWMHCQRNPLGRKYIGIPPGVLNSEKGKDAKLYNACLDKNSHHEPGKLTALIVYVDDMVVTGDDTEEIEALKNYLSRIRNEGFRTSDISSRIEVADHPRYFHVPTKVYMDLLAESGRPIAKVVTPIEANLQLRKVHMKVVLSNLRYLKKSPEKVYYSKKGGNMEVMGYTDADWAGNAVNMRSTPVILCLYVGIVTFRSKKQKVVARSSAESEFRDQLADILTKGFLLLFYSGAKTKPAEESEDYENWCSENDKVKGWLCDSMSTTLMNRYVCLETAKEVWDSLEAMYTDTSDETQIFELHRKCFSTKQSGRSIATYYDELASLFQEIDQRNTMKGESISSIALLQKYVGRLRVHMFLSGLDNVYDQVRGEILRKDPPLTLEQSYQMVRRCSVHKQGKRLELLALILMIMCEKGHTKQRCYEVIGYPEWWDFTKRPRKNIAKRNDAGKGPSVNIVQSKKNDAGKGPSVNTVQSGMKFKSNVFLANSLNNTWLIDTGASDHMVNDSNLLSSVLPSTHTTIYTANGGSSPVIGEGSTDLSKSLSLNSVLIVPALEYNILSVSKITVALKCTVTFWPQFCTFQDIVTRKFLGCGVRKGNLYFDWTDSGEERIHQVNKVGGIEETKANVWTRTDQVEEVENGDTTTITPSTEELPHNSEHLALSKSFTCTVNQLSSVSIPSNFQEALLDQRWKKAMDEEMDALQRNSTWELVDKPHGYRIVGCRWVFTIKMNSDGSIDRYKARLVAKGYTQTYGIDYEETFAPVAKINTIRILISLAANQEWPLHQFDVKNAFLNGNLEEEVYMELPPGVMNSEKGKVCKLKKALYGLKQSPRAWFGRFTKSMKAFGYRQSNSDHTLFVKRKAGKLTALIVYVDDMVVTGDDTEEIEALKNYLSQEFEMKDLGQLKYFLGIEVARSIQGISMSQRKYTLDLLAETGMLDCKPVDTPIEANHQLGMFPNQSPCDKGRYQRLVGRLIYLSHTRPDIAYAISVVSQFMHNPSKDHMKAVFRILRYLKKSPGKGLLFKKGGNMEVMGYTDADWAGNAVNMRSTSGYFMFVCGNLVTFRSKKQKVVARSSAESEFRGMAHGVCELLWIRNILKTSVLSS